MTTVPAAGRDQPLIAIDVVPVTATPADGVRVATARRVSEPYVGREALPGVLLDGPELLEHAAYRALRTKAGTTAAAVRHLVQIGAFDGPDRDPRSAAISVAFLAVVDPAAVAATAGTGTGAGSASASGAGSGDGSVTWSAPGSATGLPFDHGRIIAAALDTLRVRLWTDLALTRALLGEEFPTSAAARLVEDLTGSAPDPGNLNRSLRTNPRLVRITGAGAGTRAGAAPVSPSGRGGGRPPVVWTWADDV